MRCVTLTFGAFAVSAAAADPRLGWRDADYSYDRFLADFRAGVAPPVGAARVERERIFLSNLASIRKLNAAPDDDAVLALNDFADWSEDEFASMRSGRRTTGGTPKHWGKCTPAANSTSAIPASVDWRKSGKIVTPPKDQGGCGSCWAFSTVETIESHIAMETGKLLTLSPQQVVSCAPNPDQCGGTGGCQGSTQELGFSYAMTQPLTTEDSYSYAGTTGKCKQSKITPAAGIKGCEVLTPNDGDALARAVAKRGPIAISVAASGMKWQFYGGGVVKSCDATIDHAVQLVGYAADYWIVRNSWGKSWGESGYIRLARNPGAEKCATDRSPGDGSACKGEKGSLTVCGTCGVLSDSSYPTGGFLP